MLRTGSIILLKWMDDSYLNCFFSFVGEVSMCFTLIFPLFLKKNCVFPCFRTKSSAPNGDQGNGWE